MNAPVNHHAVIAALREENDILRETVRQLREDLAPAVTFPAAWRLTRQQAVALSCILAASPGIATHGRIMAAMYPHDESPEWARTVLTVVICELRKRLRSVGLGPAIGTACAVGYRMAAPDRDRILAAVADADRCNTVGGARV